MREIKFRAWIEPTKSMMSWKSLQESKVLALSSGLHPNDFIVLPARYELMQYTGLKDSNGTEIYEGDIVLCDRWDEPQLVFWDKFSFTCFIPEIEDYSLAFLAGYKNFKVVGNIHENPELLEG